MTTKIKRWLLGVVLGAATLLILGFALLAWLSAALDGISSKNFGLEETTKEISSRLYYWKLCQPESYHKTEYRKDGTVASIIELTKPIDGLQGIRGFSEWGGWNGDGTDWYEASASAELIEAIKAKLGSQPFKRVDYFPTKNEYNRQHAPDWWPTKMPSGAECYENGPHYLILNPTTRRVWLHFWRS